MVYKKNTFLVTGVAGFIGAALAIKLIKEGMTVVGIDNLNEYYDPVLKESRLKLITSLWDYQLEIIFILITLKSI